MLKVATLLYLAQTCVLIAIALDGLHAASVKNAPQFLTYPEQIHLAYGSTPDQMIVTWVTLDYVNESVVEYGVHDFKSLATGVSEIFVDGGSEKRKINIHRVVLSNLLPDETYSKIWLILKTNTQTRINLLPRIKSHSK